MRQAQKRSLEDIWRHLGYLIDTIKPDECTNYFENAGYASVNMNRSRRRQAMGKLAFPARLSAGRNPRALPLNQNGW